MSKVINGVNVTDLMQTIDAVKADATVAKFRFRLHNEWLEGGHNRSTLNEFYGAGQLHHRAKSFVIHADEPIVLLGSDQAPNPAEYLLTRSCGVRHKLARVSRSCARHQDRGGRVAGRGRR